ncbi:MAG: hydantoinase [Sneathiella sp.]|nr:MAG: hydantoinase [Sneathiella sp.]
MSFLIGIDTGGTYTDAVLFDEEKGVVASAKSLTTRHDYSVAVGQSVEKILAESAVQPGDIGLVSLSTTLATNALVEGQGGRVCLILIGFDEKALERNGLKDALKNDPVIFVSGGHDGQGEPLVRLDEEILQHELDAIDSQISAFAVAGMFAVRNPDHERRARDIILSRDPTNSVTCSHELSSKLDGPRRALTSVLNARLINLIHHLITATETKLGDLGIMAPLMVVQGDGALILAELAKIKPIETILSGPAASLVGGAYLSGVADAVVTDIGGTTTDVAILQNGHPRLDPDGATVGGWRTMVEAVAMYTVGLGGDSDILVEKSGLELELKLGPRRLIPVSLLAMSHPDLIREILTVQSHKPRVDENFGRFAVVVGRASAHASALASAEQDMLAQLKNAPMSLTDLLARRRDHQALERLVGAGLVQISGLTPSDAAHVLGLHKDWDAGVARQAADLFARQRDARGSAIAETGEELCRMIMETVVMRSAETLLDASLTGEKTITPQMAKALLHAGKETSDHSVIDVTIRLRLPIIGLGASAHIYYPQVAAALKTSSIIPDFAGVANAVGAVVGQVQVTSEATISKTENDYFRLFGAGEPRDFAKLEDAAAAAEETLSSDARAKAQQAGASDIHVAFKRADKTAIIQGQEFLVESLLKATAYGRPRIGQ